MLDFADNDAALLDAFSAPLSMTEAEIEAALKDYGERLIAWLQSYTGQTSAGLRKGDPPRPQHPGGWADVTGPDGAESINANYRFDVVKSGGHLVLTIYNDSPHAGWVERMNDYWVLGSAFDAPQSLEALQAALMKHLS